MTLIACLHTEAILRLDALIEGSRSVTVAAHTHPDGDALGSVSALVCYLRQRRGKDAVAVLSDSPAPSVRTIIPDGAPFLFQDREPEECLARIAGSDLLFLLDCNGFSRTEGLQEAFEASPAPKVLIDHHLNPERERFTLVFSTPEISSASELLHWILRELPDIGGDVRKFPTETARALLTGMTTDTNNFANSVYPSTFRMASDLLEAGVDRDAVLSALYNQYRENRVRAMGFLQYEDMRITPEGLAYMIATRAVRERFDLEDGETEGLVNVPLSIERVKMSILLKEETDHYRVSIRSKKGWSAQRVAAERFHGGGHENASGGKLFWPGDIPAPEDAAAYLERISRECLS
ncbi:MAG: DHH family phosphoesterase [Bacteroidales bacterium]|nr:DHH family phosphoesterase [Bacteroidales bacterium]